MYNVFSDEPVNTAVDLFSVNSDRRSFRYGNDNKFRNVDENATGADIS